MSLKSWASYVRVERGLAASTIDSYERELRNLEAWCAGSLRSATPQDVRNWLYARGGAPSTVAGRLAAARSYYSFLLRTGQAEADPTAGIDRPKVRRGLPRPVGNLDEALAGLPARSRMAATLISETGLRLAEALALEVPVPAPEAVIVKGKGSKERLLPLTDAAQDALNGLGGRVAIARSTLQRHLRQAGITAHRLRHTFASDLAEADVDLSVIQDLLGHASPATTRVYTKNRLSRLRAGLERRRKES